MLKTFHVSIKALIVADGRVLLMKKRVSAGEMPYWDAPGGRMDTGENMPQTLARELKEELPGFSPTSVPRIAHVATIQTYKENMPEIGLCFVFMRIDAPVFDVTLSDEHLEYRWFSKDELMQLEGFFDASVQTCYRQAFQALF